MKKVSNEFINLSKKIKTQDLKLTINDGELTVQEVHFMPVNIFNSIPISRLRARKEVIAKELKYSFEGQLFKTIMQQIEITVKNASEIKGKKVDFKYGILINNEFEYLDMGEYYIKDVEDDKNKEELVVTGYDKMLNFMTPFKQSDLKLTYPCKMGQLVSRMGEVCGVEVYSTDFYNSDLIVDEDFFTIQELTYRDVLEKIAQTTLTTIFIKENKLYLCKIGESIQTLDTSFLSNLVIGEKFGPVNALVLGRGSVEDNIESVDQQSINANGRCEIRFDENEFIDSKREEVIDGMLQQINGLEYYAIEASNLGILWLDPCDVIIAKDREESEYKTIYLKASVTINTGIEGEMEADIPEETTTEYKVKTKEEKKTLKVERLAKKNEGLIQDIIKETSKNTKKLSQHEQTIDSIKDTVKALTKSAITSVSVEYALSDSTTAEPQENWSTTAPEWQEGKYMWQRTVTTYEDGVVITGEATCISGATGQQGVGISKVETQYYLSTSETTQTGGSWKTTQDEWKEGTYYWIRTKITYDNNNVEYTTPILNEDTNSLREIVTTVEKKADGLAIDVKKKVNDEDLTGANLLLRINGDTSEAQINADKVNINGILSANGNFEVDTDGNMSATSATLNNAIITSSNSEAEVSINDGNIKTTSSEGYKGVEIVEQNIRLYSYNDQNNFIGALCSAIGEGTGRQFIELYADYGDSLALGYKLEEATNTIIKAIEVNSDNNGLIDIYNKVNMNESRLENVKDPIFHLYVSKDDYYWGYAVIGYRDQHKYFLDWTTQLLFYVDGQNVGTLSDKRLKTEIQDIDEDFIKAIEEVEMKQFKVANRNGLISFGILAQDLIEIFKKYNKNPFDYEIVYKTQFRIDDDTIYYAINYEQFLILKQKAMDKKIEELQTKDKQKDEIITDLIQRIETLEKEVNK